MPVQLRPAEDLLDEESPTVNRKAASKGVLWDQNFREWTKGRPLCLPHHDHEYVRRAVHNDTQFLSGLSIVDYSLMLVAAPPVEDGATSRLALGIIDYVCPYTWDKQMESMLKKQIGNMSLTGEMPTIIEPTEYARRFQQAMKTYFVAETPPVAAEGVDDSQ